MMNEVAGVEARRAPGPRGLPFVGNLLPVWNDPIGLFLSAREAYGDIVHFKVGPHNVYLVADPDAVHRVLVDNAKNYTKSRNYVGLKVILGDGLLTSEGEHWRRQRKLAQPAFHREHLARFAAQMSAATRGMLDRWKREEAERPGAVFCVHREMMRLTFRIVGLTLLSSDVDGDAKDVGEALEIALRWADDYANALIRVPPAIPTPMNVRFNRAMKTLDGVVFRLIAERRARVGDRGDDLLGIMMEATEEGSGRTMDDRQLRDELITMVLAGHETTANLLSWAFYLLSKHPDVERAVRDEVVRVLGDREPGLEDLKALTYTKMVIEETLRLYPPAWVYDRQALGRDTLGGFAIEPGGIAVVCPYVIHRHPKLWENPEGFDPSRFRPGASSSRPRYAYLPFGGGPRTCIGNHFALMEAQIILAMTVREHRFELDPSTPVALDPVVTLRPKHGVRGRRRPGAATAS